METYTLTPDEVKLEVFQALMDEFKELREARNISGGDGDPGNGEILEMLETAFANCFNKTKDKIENG